MSVSGDHSLELREFSFGFKFLFVKKTHLKSKAKSVNYFLRFRKYIATLTFPKRTCLGIEHAFLFIFSL